MSRGGGKCFEVIKKKMPYNKIKKKTSFFKTLYVEGFY